MAKLGDICTFQSGGTPSKSNSEYFNGSIPWITTVALTGDYIDKNDAVDWITDKAIQESAAKIVPENSILVGTRVGIGKVAINTVPMSTSQDIVSLINVDDTEWDKRFLCKVISARNPYLLSQARGATIKGIKIDTLAKLEIPEIPLNEQRHIAAVLDKASDLIAKRREQLDKLDELVKARFVEMFGDPINNTKGLPTTPLGEICYLKAGVTTASDEIHSQSKEYSVPCYGGNGIRGYVKEATQRGTYPIIGRQGALCGNVQLAIGEFHATEHAVLVSPIIKTNVIWVYYLLKFMDLYRYHTGAAQPGLAVKTLNMVEIPCADIGLQNEFATFAEQVEKSKLTIQQSLDKLEVLKKALMQQYFG